MHCTLKLGKNVGPLLCFTRVWHIGNFQNVAANLIVSVWIWGVFYPCLKVGQLLRVFMFQLIQPKNKTLRPTNLGQLSSITLRECTWPPRILVCKFAVVFSVCTGIAEEPIDKCRPDRQLWAHCCRVGGASPREEMCQTSTRVYEENCSHTGKLSLLIGSPAGTHLHASIRQIPRKRQKAIDFLKTKLFWS